MATRPRPASRRKCPPITPVAIVIVQRHKSHGNLGNPACSSEEILRIIASRFDSSRVNGNRACGGESWYRSADRYSGNIQSQVLSGPDRKESAAHEWNQPFHPAVAFRRGTTPRCLDRLPRPIQRRQAPSGSVPVAVFRHSPSCRVGDYGGAHHWPRLLACLRYHTGPYGTNGHL